MAKNKRGTWFPHLHIHDEYSIKDGCSSVETYADIVQELGGGALAITNHGMAAGFARQYFACKDRGIKPIFGMEAYVNEHRLKPIREAMAELRKRVKAKVPGAKDKLAKVEAFMKEEFRPSAHAIILAKTREGYRNLVRMSTDSWTRGFYYAPRTDTKYLEDHAEGLVFSTACIGGFIPKMARNDFDAAVKEAKRLKGIFGPNFYVEIMITEYEKQRHTNEVMMRLAHEVGAPTIVTCDVHYAKASDSMAQDVLLLMRDDKTISDKEAGEGVWQFATKDLWWRTLEDVTACWSKHHSDYLPKEDFRRALKNTYRLADEIEDIEFDTSLKLPGVFKEPRATMKELCLKGFRELVARGAMPASGKSKRDYTERLQREVKVINDKGFSEYFLVLHDICDQARKLGARMGPGRGSAGGSLVAYLLGITEIDPLRFGLLFERFLDPGRPDPPDIDLDFSPDHRGGIKAYVEKRYPATATIGTYATFKPRATFQNVGRVFNIPYQEVLKITKSLGTDADKLTWDQIFDLWPEVSRWADDHPEAFSVIQTLKGLISHRGKHAAAMLVAPADALSEIPMIVESDGQVVTAIPDTQGDGVTHKGRELTRLGYLKMDILGVRNVDIAPTAVELLERETGKKVDLSALDLDDQKAMETATSGDVPGVFQLDTGTTRPILRHVGVDSFMDLVMITALARPGPLKHQIHRVYAKLKRKGDAWKNNVHPDLVDLLADSRGLMILQEDVMHVVQALGGLTFQQANAVRKAIGKKLDEEAFEPSRKLFVEGGVSRGHDRSAMEDTWKKIITFSQYGFNKAHAVAYMITSYQQLYMLSHHPLFYFASLLANTPRTKKSYDDDVIVGFIRAAMARGVPVTKPDVISGGIEFDVEGRSVRYGLGKIKGVAGAAPEIVAARPFDCIEDFFDQVNKRRVNKKVFDALILSGACDRLEWDAGEVPAVTQDDDPLQVRNALLARYHQLKKAKDEPDNYTLAVLREKERDLLGLSLSWWGSSDKDKIREGEDLTTVAKAKAEGMARFGVVVEVTKAREHKTRKGPKMAFLTVSDETETLDNVVVWPEQWKVHKERLKKGRIAIVRFRRKENDNDRYGRWSYHIDDRWRHGPAVESAVRVARRLA